MVVIPVYRQPLFLVEAVGSVLAQQTALSVVAVVVDDGCPLRSTFDTASVLAARYPEQVVYLRYGNGGLSAARNRGIEFALQAWPELKAIYFLDSDNRILPGFLDRVFRALWMHRAGWAYPDIDMFGIPGFYSTKGDYSLLLHLSYNYCEAGSLVAREVFDRGARFDEAMRLGFEDWEFWWQAAELGFRGVFVPDAGFCYRRRGESMLRDAERNREEILAAMRRKHASLFRVRNLLRIEAGELPRYRLALVERDEVRPLLDPALWNSAEAVSGASSVASFAAAFSRADGAPAAFAAPRLIAVAHARTIRLLARAKLIRYLFWLAEHLLPSCPFVVVRLHAGTSSRCAVRRVEHRATAAEIAGAAMLLVAGPAVREVVRDPDSAWIDSLTGAAPMPQVELVEIELPARLGAPPAFRRPYQVAGRMVTLLGELRRHCQIPPNLPQDWRADDRTERRDASRNLLADLGLGTVLPHLPPRDRKQVGFLLPIFSFGGVEKVAANYALILKDHGYDCHLFLTEHDGLEFTALLDRAFESVNFVSAAGQCAFDGSLGAPVLTGLTRQNREALGLLATMDVVFNTHAVRMHGLTGELKRQGIKTLVGLHLNDVTAAGLPFGNANFALAYEHVYDGFVVISEELRRWCLGQAIPAEKIHLVRNAPSYQVSAAELAATAALRAARAAAPDALRVLYLGRLDAQKGMDRLAAIHAATIGPAVAWRVAGKAVVREDQDRPLPARWEIEPPALRDEDLTALYQWADVVVLPSRYEGVPLTLIEAQRLGAVVIATAVGGVAEIVIDRSDGFLVEPRAAEAAITGAFVAIIGELAQDRALLHRISQAAMGRAATLRWSETMAGFLGAMTGLLGGKAMP